MEAIKTETTNTIFTKEGCFDLPGTRYIYEDGTPGIETCWQLTEEEMFCIRYHMGAFTDKAEWAYYTRAIHQFPNVLWVHHADMIAAHIVGV